jgi:two-component system, cell cycle sensor histidine kinase and response regulator CckA
VVKGRTVAIVGALSDITARKLAQSALRESEQRFRHIAELSPFPIAILETDGRYIFVNQRFMEVFGYTVEEIPTGKAWFRLAFPDPQYRKGAISNWISDLEKSRTFEVRPREYIVRCKDGRFRDILFRPITMEGGKHFITYEDRTELRQIEQERLRLAKLESVGILAGGIAHDFNNLLTAIVGNISLARIDPTRSDKVIARLEEAEKAAARAKDLTSQLLTFSKGGAPVKKAMFLQRMIQETCGLILSGSKSRCEFDIAPDLWPVEVDEGQISQVITNVLLNADQAMPTGGTIKLRALNCTLEAGHSLPLEPGRYIQIAIGDEGVGIGSEHLPKVFDPYFTTKQGGSGLGLATVHSVVSKHGGYVTAESEIGHGTTIIIYLPAARGQVDGLASLADSEAFTKGKGRILVMDDEEMIRDLASAILTHLGYEAEFAENGEQAIAQYERAKATGRPFDAVLMDLTIRGGMGGQEAVAVLRSMDPKVKAIVSSGYSNDPVMAEYGDYGFVGVVAKPYRIEELSEVLQRVLASTT